MYRKTLGAGPAFPPAESYGESGECKYPNHFVDESIGSVAWNGRLHGSLFGELGREVAG